MSMKTIERKRNGVNVVNCFFYSALACMVPFLSAHMREIGITKIQTAWITSMVSLISMIGPLCLGPIAYKFNAYKSLLVICLITSLISYTALLFIPKVIRSERQPKILLDCTSSILRVERCANWYGQCHTYPKRSANNFSNFQVHSCNIECPVSGSSNASWFPIQVCFRGFNEESNLCQTYYNREHQISSEHHLKRNDKTKLNLSKEDSSKSIGDAIQFDSSFYRWPVIDGTDDDIVRRLFNSATCTYQPTPPLLIDQKLYVNVQCRPFVPNCHIYCKVNLRHRRTFPNNKEAPLRSPAPCLIETGDANQTFYLYLIIRSFADFSLFTAYTLLDALSVALTNDFDSIYGGYSKLWAIMLPMIAWPPICGQVIDYFSSMGSPNYAPPIVIFDGLVIITAFLVIMMPLSPITMLSKSISQSIGRNSPVIPTKQLYPRQHSKKSAICRLIFLFPLILILGSEWGFLETFLHPFYIDMGLTKLSLGLTFTATFLSAAPFTLIAKALINGVGRVHLIVLAFIFYSLRFGGISYLLYPKWLFIPLEMMESFSLPIAWIGITSYCHHLIKRSPIASTYATGTIYQKYSHHIILQYTLNLIHFGGGRALGAVIGGVWLLSWPQYDYMFYWLYDIDIDYAEGSFEAEDGFRVLLRLLAIISASIGIIFAIVYHCCCKGIRCKSKNSKNKKLTTEELPPVVLNGNYSRLMDSQSKNENIQLKNSEPKTISSTTNQKRTNGESRIKMADEDADEEETLLT